jgi:hypothetical protein
MDRDEVRTTTRTVHAGHQRDGGLDVLVYRRSRSPRSVRPSAWRGEGVPSHSATVGAASCPDRRFRERAVARMVSCACSSEVVRASSDAVTISGRTPTCSIARPLDSW